ncbi:hypothetical protein T439DRAFT_160173 [Meredithblackwellia eburnea MCA 4105]
MPFTADPSRPYGISCRSCKQRRRKCRFTTTGCDQCDKRGEKCPGPSVQQARKRRKEPAGINSPPNPQDNISSFHARTNLNPSSIASKIETAAFSRQLELDLVKDFAQEWAPRHQGMSTSRLLALAEMPQGNGSSGFNENPPLPSQVYYHLFE